MSFSAADRREQLRARTAVRLETAVQVELCEEDLPDGPAPTSLVIGGSI